MSSAASQLFRLIQRGRFLEKQGLIDGFESYQEWRDDIVHVIESLKTDFENTVQTPLQIDHGIKWIERTFQLD